MAMGILGQHAWTGAVTATQVTVYEVPVGKVATFNIFATNHTTQLRGDVMINNTIIGFALMATSTYPSGQNNVQFKGIIGNAGTTVSFNGCSGIVTGYEEDA